MLLQIPIRIVIFAQKGGIKMKNFEKIVIEFEVNGKVYKTSATFDPYAIYASKTREYGINHEILKFMKENSITGSYVIRATYFP